MQGAGQGLKSEEHRILSRAQIFLKTECPNLEGHALETATWPPLPSEGFE